MLAKRGGLEREPVRLLTLQTFDELNSTDDQDTTLNDTSYGCVSGGTALYQNGNANVPSHQNNVVGGSGNGRSRDNIPAKAKSWEFLSKLQGMAEEKSERLWAQKEEHENQLQDRNQMIKTQTRQLEDATIPSKTGKAASRRRKEIGAVFEAAPAPDQRTVR